jgi:Protein of unknown function (DUF3300)
MATRARPFGIWRELRTFRGSVAVFCAALLAPGGWMISARAAQTTNAQTEAAPEAPVKLSNDQLDSLVAPIALYPDPLLSQTLVAATYPLEVVQLQQWLEKNKDLKDEALADAVKKQDWDPSIQSMAGLPEVVKRLADDIKWTTDLGNAFLVQQSDVMDAVQRMRKKAQDKGNLKPSEQQKVETKVVETKEVIVIEQADPQVIYVPTYNPTVVYGPPIYPYPPIYYPPPGYYAAGMAISFGIGIAMGAFWGGGWGYHCGWGHNDININVHNNFHQNNINRGGNRGGGNNWQHNPQHRGGAPYGDRATANKYGGTARGDSMSTRQSSARQQQARTTSRSSGGGGDRVGNRSVSSSGRSGSSGAFGGASSGMSGRSTRSSSSRGSSSFGGSRGGGGRRR